MKNNKKRKKKGRIGTGESGRNDDRFIKYRMSGNFGDDYER